jgi:hypothetical protein
MKIDHFLIKRKVTPKNRPIFEIQKGKVIRENRLFSKKGRSHLKID